MANNSLNENIRWLEENKELFLTKLDSMLEQPSGLTLASSWTDIATFIMNLSTFIAEDYEGTIEELEHFLNNTFEKTIEISGQTINSYTFYSKTSLPGVIGNNVTNINSYAFQSCTNLLKALFPVATTVGDYAFNGANKLSTITLGENYTVGTSSFSSCSMLKTIVGSCKTLGGSSFTSCTALEHFDFSSVTSASTSGYTFQSCTMLKDVILNGKFTVPKYFLNGCSAVRDIIITTDVTGMAQYALSDINSNVRIFCEQPSQPTNWNTNWNYTKYPVYWNATEKNWIFVFNNDKPNEYKKLRYVDEVPNPGEKEGYTFDNWYTDVDLTKPLALPYTSVDQIPMVYAGWAKNIIIVAKNTDTGEILEFTWPFKNLNTMPSNKDCGCIPNGWYIDPEYTIEFSGEEQLVELNQKIYTYGGAITDYEFDFSGEVQSARLFPGIYRLECWGASGTPRKNGTESSIYYGGYAAGTLKLTEPTVFYIYVGGMAGFKGTDYYKGGWNGGGGSLSTATLDNGVGGGGTDICLIPSEVIYDSTGRYVRTQESYASRLLVAGGGGSGRGSDTGCAGGYVPALSLTVPNSYTGGLNSSGSATSSASNGASGFGFGTSGILSGDDDPSGGGGWYGGGITRDNCGYGGSSYAWCDELATYVPTNYSVPEKLKLTSTVFKAGNQQQPSTVNSTVEELGHQGHGYAKITKIGSI